MNGDAPVQLGLPLWSDQKGENIYRISDTNPNPEPDWDDVTFLETALKWAKRGETSGIAIAILQPDRKITTAYTQSAKEDCFRMLGVVETLRHRLCKYVEDQA